MVFTDTTLKGAFIVDIERREDTRGFFARAFCQREFEGKGLRSVVARAKVANRRRGTVRRMRFQLPPHAEAKLVRVTRGAVLDVVVDLRPESTTCLQHESVTLSADNHRALYVPERFAHGYQALEDGSELTYQSSTAYALGFDSGLSPFDPQLAIAWPERLIEVSAKDSGWEHLAKVECGINRRMTA